MASALTLLGVAAALAAASPLQEKPAGATQQQQQQQQPKSFLKEIGPSTWVLGNELWNVTQNAQYANKLMYRGKDRVGNAVGHYVSYSMLSCPLDILFLETNKISYRWRGIRSHMDVCSDCRFGCGLD